MEKEDEHKLLAIWAVDCAKHVLKYFNKDNPNDDRVINAIKAAKDWAKGKIKVSEARKAAFAAHAAARDSKNPKSIAAARSAGHAAATAHVKTHAKHTADYAIKSGGDKEKEWQNKQKNKLSSKH